MEFLVRLLATGYALLALRAVLVVATLGPASGTHKIRNGTDGYPIWSGMAERFAPDAKPPMGGVLAEDEYRKVLFRSLYDYGLSAVRFGAPVQAIPCLKKAYEVSVGTADRVRCVGLLCAARVLAGFPAPLAALVRRTATLAADLRRKLSKPYWEV